MSNLGSYYQKLGVSPGSPKSVVKKAYWKLAKKYHPDVNPSKQANQKFLEITTAYEAIVEGKIPRQQQKQSPQSSYQDPFEKYKDVYSPPKDPLEYAEWVKVAKKRAEEFSRKQYKALQAYIRFWDNLRKTFFYPSLVTGLLALLFITDHFLPLVWEESRVESVSELGKVELESGVSFRGGRMAKLFLQYKDVCVVSRSPIFNVVEVYGYESGGEIVGHKLTETFYLWGGFYNYVLLSFSIFLLVSRRFVAGNFFAVYFIVLLWGLVQWWWY